MNDDDKNIACARCGEVFVFTAAERDFYCQKGFAHEPKRCKRCRRAQRSDTVVPRDAKPRMSTHFEYAGVPAGVRARPPRRQCQESFEQTCSQCGALTRLSFVPDGVRPVYCRSCFHNRRHTGAHRS